MDRLTPALHPGTSHIGYQRWTQLSFIHWRLPAEAVQKLLPDGLTVDTFDGDAWLGLVPFHMSGVRPRWFPLVPGVSSFHETNVRTYVHCEGDHPGVYFFSLEAANGLPVRVARRKWHLPYHKAEMKIFSSTRQINQNQDEELTIQYQSKRLWPGKAGVGTDLKIRVGSPCRFQKNDSGNTPEPAQPETLEHFLAERYYLYADRPTGTLYRGQVHHNPYPLYHAEVVECEESLTADAGFPDLGEPCHVLYSPGVNVKIFSLKPVTR